jgi:hypothetical protein
MKPAFHAAEHPRAALAALRWPRGSLLLAVLLAAMLALAFDGRLHRHGEAQLGAAAERALAAFAVSRGLNGVISVLQEFEVGFSLGVNGSLEPGQVLDPLNDLVERFSLAALLAATLLWTLQLLGDLLSGPWLAGSLLLLLAAAVALWRIDRWGSSELGGLALRLVHVIATLWLFAALTPQAIQAVHASDPVQARYTAARAGLARAADLLGESDTRSGMPRFDDIRARLATLGDLAEQLSRDMIALLAVFTFEVVLVPLLVFWFGVRLLRVAPGRAVWPRARGRAPGDLPAEH